ncbi:MAG: SGNH/GDSL hydrolase family protein [Clostridiales bacterium]|nr:SGNH/GDSL hydrolase family protein [Clostridiales bacterium]
METITAFGDSVLKGVIYEDEHYKVSDSSFQKICEESFGIVIENKAKFGSTISKGESIFERNLDTIRHSSGKYVVLEFGGNDCDFNWKEVAETPDEEHLPMSTIENFTATYSAIIKEIKEMGKIPVLLSLPPIDSARYFKQISRGLNGENIMRWMREDRQYITNWHERYNIEIFKLAIANEVPVIDITSVFLEKKNYSYYLCEDGIHPNVKGHRLIAQAIKDHVTRRNISFDENKG